MEEKVIEAQKMWRLQRLCLVRRTGYASVYACESARHGHCMLKVCKPNPESHTEYYTLNEYDGQGYCRVYGVDLARGLLLEERVLPGTRLREEPDAAKRLAVFCGVFRTLHKPPIEPHLYPTYGDWVRRAAEYMQSTQGHDELCAYMQRAATVYAALRREYTGQMLLHGDLHHDNLLLNAQGGYTAIDPKGVVGDAVFDVARYVRNELSPKVDDALRHKVEGLLRDLAAALHYPTAVLAKCLFVECAMGESWYLQAGDKPYSIEHVRLAEQILLALE